MEAVPLDPSILITGANSGLGLVTAKTLAARGAEIILICRDADKSEAARRAIVEASGNSRVRAHFADLGSQHQIRRVAAEILAAYPRLSILINNAGLLLGKRTLTEDGFETTFAVNHLGYFLLTRLLMDRLRASAPARIINVSSLVHRGGRIRFDDLSMERGFIPMAAYAQSKLANILFTYALAHRLEGSGVTVNCLHPGVVDTHFGHQGSALYKSFKTLARPLMYISPERGAETQIHLAVTPELERVSGAYFVKCRAVNSSPASYNRTDQERLWTLSEHMTGLPHWPLP